jgi:hypothetical protein
MIIVIKLINLELFFIFHKPYKFDLRKNDFPSDL